MCFRRHFCLFVFVAAVLWAPATAGANDLPNGSFEQGLSGWGTKNARAVILSGGTSGTKYARARRRASGAFGLVTRPAARKGQRLSVRAKLRGSRGLRVCVRVRERRRSGAIVGGKHACRAAKRSWQQSPRLRYTVRRGNTRIVLAFYGKGAGGKRKHVDVDAAVLTKTSGSGAVPGPIAGKGYRRVFHDGFSRLGSLDWDKGTWTGGPANAIFVRNGVLNLVSRRSQNYPDVDVSTEAGPHPKRFRRGYFEARMRWTKGKGAWPAFWLNSYRHATNPNWQSGTVNPYCQNNGLPVAQCWNAELDIFEGQGDQPHVFYGTLHRNTNGPDLYGVPDSTNDPSWRTVGPNLTKGWHKYAVLWTANEVRWYLDGRRVLRAPTYDSTDQPMHILFDMWIGWEDEADASTPDVLRTQVDYVSVWQK